MEAKITRYRQSAFLRQQRSSARLTSGNGNIWTMLRKLGRQQQRGAKKRLHFIQRLGDTRASLSWRKLQARNNLNERKQNNHRMPRSDIFLTATKNFAQNEHRRAATAIPRQRRRPIPQHLLPKKYELAPQDDVNALVLAARKIKVQDNGRLFQKARQKALPFLKSGLKPMSRPHTAPHTQNFGRKASQPMNGLLWKRKRRPITANM